MHELSIAQSILVIAEKAVPANNVTVVTGVSIEIGELSGIEIDALEFAFSIIKADTILAQAELKIEIVKGEAVCLDCHSIFHLSAYGTCCPQCSSYSMKITKGKEMKVINIIVDIDE
jgi:hydrogenase nickel incorporation protein HypA/HybF